MLVYVGLGAMQEWRHPETGAPGVKQKYKSLFLISTHFWSQFDSP